MLQRHEAVSDLVLLGASITKRTGHGICTPDCQATTSYRDAGSGRLLSLE